MFPITDGFLRYRRVFFRPTSRSGSLRSERNAVIEGEREALRVGAANQLEHQPANTAMANVTTGAAVGSERCGPDKDCKASICHCAARSWR